MGRYGAGAWGNPGYHRWWDYPGAWYPAGWSPATAWTFAGATALSSLLGLTIGALAGIPYGSVVYDGDSVIVDGQPYCSAEQYYQQALDLALSSPVSAAMMAGGEQWQPLGVFGLAPPGQTQPTMIVQLAIDQYGIVRGNYTNQLTGETELVNGVLDTRTQRLTWVIGSNTATVFDTSLYALMQPESSILVHYGPLSTDQMLAVRLPEPASVM